ncbi:MAG: hypothetical protein R3E95_08750 [Thiolinea sp.]
MYASEAEQKQAWEDIKQAERQSQGKDRYMRGFCRYSGGDALPCAVVRKSAVNARRGRV